ncbi:PhnD/SsuA/transferrin family substrate-binding protein [Elioraea sp.]|uniref:substrate-binding domain-containing protein n=1 Tax=Elioraea sp. TaxID=2185103 RepID=UPI0025C1A8BC|nr:PhnD/SsuA/transferrin family substrate-binding protein [Elioraea sp.]
MAASPALALASGWSGSARAARPITLGLTPVFLDSDIVLVRQIEAYLSRRLGRTVQVVKRRTYREISALLIAGQLDAAWICGFPFVQHREALSLVAAPLYRGASLYRSYVIVRRDRRAESLADLSGDIHAFSDPDSNSGFLVTSAALAARGETAAGFFARSFFTYGHRNVIRAVASGLAQSGSVDGYVWDVMAELEPALVRATRILRTSEPMGFPPIAASRQTEPSIIAATKAAFLGMDRSTIGQEILATLRLDGFAPVAPSQFDSIAALWRQVREAG